MVIVIINVYKIWGRKLYSWFEGGVEVNFGEVMFFVFIREKGDVFSFFCYGYDEFIVYYEFGSGIGVKVDVN